MSIDFNEDPHRRYNILTGEWILVSPHRNKRPWQGKVEEKQDKKKESYDPKCYLCPGNTRASGAVTPEYTDTYAFINDYSALLPDSPTDEIVDGLLRAKGERGICKVICFSPDHSLTLADMSREAIANVIRLWQKEYKELGTQEDINHVQIFENKGAMMGCSNPHPHGQIWSQSSIPNEVLKKSHHQKEYWEDKGESLLSAYLQQEIDAQERIIYANEECAVLVPYWATWPYEAMIIPRRHMRDISEMTDVEVVGYSDALKVLTVKFDRLFDTSFPYSAGIHQAPTDGADYDYWHWHMTFYPPLLRSATVRKFMVGYEMFANAQRDITAEMAAAQLRDL